MWSSFRSAAKAVAETSSFVSERWQSKLRFEDRNMRDFMVIGRELSTNPPMIRLTRLRGVVKVTAKSDEALNSLESMDFFDVQTTSAHR
jgi:hypothetical protein